MIPSFTTSVPPRIPPNVATDTLYSRVLKTEKINSLSVDSSKVTGIATLVAGTVDVTIPGIESTDLVFVTLHSINSSPALGAQYTSTFHAAVGTTPAYITIASYAANAAAATLPNFSILPPKPSTSVEPLFRFLLKSSMSAMSLRVNALVPVAIIPTLSGCD